MRPKHCFPYFWNLLSLSLLVSACAACSSFHREWKAAAAQPQPPDSIEGCWDGKWKSNRNGHTGRLRCLITRTNDEQYGARFHANYLKILRFGYTVPLKVRQVAGVSHFEGQADLGQFAGGIYHYEGEAGSDRFVSTYRSERDHGVFEMKRPEGDP